MKTTPADNQQA